jgi:cytochrome c-type biogenesis protein CcmH/NrfG
MTVVVTPTPGPVTAPSLAKSKVEVHFELGEALSPLKGEAPSSALVASYEKDAENNPNDSRAWRKLGIIYLKTGQNAKGIQCLEESLRLNPNDQALKKWLEDYRTHHPDMP